MNFGWIEIVLFYGFAIGFAVWQYWKTDRELKATRAKRLEEEAKAKDREGDAARKPQKNENGSQA